MKSMKKHRGLLFFMLIVLMPVLLLSTCALGEIQRPGGENERHTRVMTIAATGGLCNYFLPWDYLSDAPYENGSLAQAASAIRELRENNQYTLLIDCGDSMSGSARDLFSGDPVEPMAAGMNALRYDACAAGTSDFLSGAERFRKLKRSLNAPFLAANIYDAASGEYFADECAVIECDGLRAGVFSLLAPDPDFQAITGCGVSDPMESARRVIDAYQNQCDIFIAVVRAPDDSGAFIGELAAACPELDLIFSPPEPEAVPAQDLSVITLTIEAKSSLSGGWSVRDATREVLRLSDYPPDPDLSVQLNPYDSWAKETVRAGF